MRQTRGERPHRFRVDDSASTVSVALLRQAHRRFEEEEPRNLFYRAATFLIECAHQPSAKLTLAESLAVLLQTWNAQYYRFRGGFRERNFTRLEALLERQAQTLAVWRGWRLGVDPIDPARVSTVFTDFEGELGPVGAAKALHLLAPQYFPLWDRAIAAQTYHLTLASPAAGSYVKLMARVSDEIGACGGWSAFAPGENAVKLIDELHYCRSTLRLPV